MDDTMPEGITVEMENLKLVSWNVNGLRAAYKKGFLDWLAVTQPDILCLQEIKAWKSQLSDELAQPPGYFAYWNSAGKAGYGGTALISREEPISVDFGLGDARFDQEGRTIVAKYPDFTLVNCYFPNGNRSEARLQFKLDFYDAFLAHCEALRSHGCALVFCGDLNTAHTEIDLANPRSNTRKSGFLPAERRWIDRIIQAGYVDTFRHFYPDIPGKYTWWSYLPSSRERNVGWRFDYFFVAMEAIQRVTAAFIMSGVTQSDHCPIGISFNAGIRRGDHLKSAKPMSTQLRLF